MRIKNYLRYLRADKKDKDFANKFKHSRCKKDSLIVIMQEEQNDLLPPYAAGTAIGMVVSKGENVKDVTICDRISFSVRNSNKAFVRELDEDVYVVHYNQILYFYGG
jgi:hypothetical protein